MNAQKIRQKKYLDQSWFDQIEVQDEGENKQITFKKKQDLKYDIAAKKLRAKTKVKEKVRKLTNSKEVQQQVLSLNQSGLQMRNIAIERNSQLNESQRIKKLDSKPYLNFKMQSQVQQKREGNDLQSQAEQFIQKLQIQKDKIQQQNEQEKKQIEQKAQLKIKKLSTSSHLKNYKLIFTKDIEESIEKQAF